jgi:hypothetical protein
MQTRGFIAYNRKPLGYRPPAERLKDWKEVNENLPTPGEHTAVRTHTACCHSAHLVTLLRQHPCGNFGEPDMSSHVI